MVLRLCFEEIVSSRWNVSFYNATITLMVYTRVLPGMKFNRLFVLSGFRYHTTSSGNKRRMVLCRCDCGIEKYILCVSLTSNNTLSCGCLNDELRRRFVDITGRRYGNLVAVRRVGSMMESATWLCVCDCGNTKVVRKNSLDKDTRSCGCKKYSGIKIALASQKRIENLPRGRHHFNWKGGITSENRQARNSTEYKTWRRAVFERDDYTCVLCGTIGGVLNADHIMPFAEYKNLRFDTNNGRTLCVSCHRKTETFGRRPIVVALTSHDHLSHP